MEEKLTAEKARKIAAKARKSRGFDYLLELLHMRALAGDYNTQVHKLIMKEDDAEKLRELGFKVEYNERLETWTVYW